MNPRHRSTSGKARRTEQLERKLAGVAVFRRRVDISLKKSSISASDEYPGRSSSYDKANVASRRHPSTLRLAVGRKANSDIACASASIAAGGTPRRRSWAITASRNLAPSDLLSRAGTSTTSRVRSFMHTTSCCGRVCRRLAYQSPSTVVGGEVPVFAGTPSRRRSFCVHRSVTIGKKWAKPTILLRLGVELRRRSGSLPG